MMAPIVVAFLPTTDDAHGDCRSQLLAVGDYLPVVKPFTNHPKLDATASTLVSHRDPKLLVSHVNPTFMDSAISNNLHALVAAGIAALVVVGIGIIFQLWRDRPSMTEYNWGTWINFGIGIVVVGFTWGAIFAWYPWVTQQHAKAACAMVLFLAAAALTNFFVVRKKKDTFYRTFSTIYGAAGLLMIILGILFAIDYEWGNRQLLGGHLVFIIEAAEFGLFFIYWFVQTIDRWTETV